MSVSLELPAFSALTGASSPGRRFLEVSEDALTSLIASVLRHVRVDEAWYIRTYGDVAAALDRGEFESAAEHFARFGYFEDRLPREVIVDEEWYRLEYPDVREAIDAGKFVSGQQHFVMNGYREGRRPYSDWSLCS